MMDLTGDAPQRTVSLYGLALRSSFPFATHLPDTTGRPGITLDCRPGPAPGFQEGPPVHASPHRLADGRSAMEAWPAAQGVDLRFPGLADVTVRPGRITAWVSEDTRADLLEVRLLGPVLALALEGAGVIALHASAVEMAGGAVAFAATNRSGKSWLAAACLQAGHRLVSDDIVPLEPGAEGFVARPGIPEMRLRPADLAVLGRGAQGLRPVLADGDKLRVPLAAGAAGDFCPTPLPLRRVYLPRLVPDEAGARPRVLPVPGSQALMALVECSFAARLLEALGWQPARLELFARLVRGTTFRALEVPRGLQHLASAVEALRGDVDWSA
jgi:hypothetical protein